MPPGDSAGYDIKEFSQTSGDFHFPFVIQQSSSLQKGLIAALGPFPMFFQKPHASRVRLVTQSHRGRDSRAAAHFTDSWLEAPRDLGLPLFLSSVVGPRAQGEESRGNRKETWAADGSWCPLCAQPGPGCCGSLRSGPAHFQQKLLRPSAITVVWRSSI